MTSKTGDKYVNSTDDILGLLCEKCCGTIGIMLPWKN